MSYVEGGLGDPATQLAPYLRPGERLLWSGRPDPNVRFTRADAFLVPFSIMWGGFAIVWETTVLVAGAPLLFTLWGIPFVALGLYLMVGRFIFKRRNKLRTAYGLTHDRALVAVGTTRLHEAPIQQTPMSIQQSRDGTHVSITFGNQVGPAAGTYANTGMDFLGRASSPVAFYDVPDGRSFLAVLNRAQVR